MVLKKNPDENNNNNINNNNYNNNNDDNNNNNNNNGSNNDDDYEIKQINNCFKMIDETKSFEEQINLLKEMDNLCEYWHMHIFQKTLTKSYLKKYLVIHL